MLSGAGKSGRAVLKSALASVLALLAFAMCAPQLAFADETTQAINGTMTITLQDGGASGAVVGGGASALGKASSGTATGDALMWLILGVVVLIAGAVYVFIKSRSLATNTGAHANVSTSSKKKTIIVAIITALIACTCFGMFANKGVAFAKDTFNNIFGSSAVVVDNDGNVLSNSISVINNEEEAIIVKNIEAPSALFGWNADITDKTIESGKVAEGSWDGKTIPASVLEQLKNNNNYLELTFTMNVTDAKKSLNFDEFLVGEGTKDYTYTGQQITPAVSSLVYSESDFEVTYGENINVGEGIVTIKGIGDYKGEQTYTFTITKAPLTVTTPSAEKVYDSTALTASATAENLQGLVNGETATVKVSGSQIAVGSSKNTYAGIEWGTAKEGNYEVTSVTEGTLTVTQYAGEITVKTTGGTFTYDGKEHKATVDVEGLPTGYKVETAISSASATDVNGDGIEAKADTLVIVNAQIEDVTDKLNIKYVNDTLKITPATLTVNTPSDEKVYDGTALTAEGSITGFVNGETAAFTTTGAQTDVGESENTYTIDWNDTASTAKQANYNITEELGTLKVTANTTPITVTVGDTSITYNGKVLTGDIKVTGVPEGFTYEAKTSGSQQDVGTNKCSVAEFTIFDANKNDVTKNFSNITKNEGTLTVNARTVTLTSESATKTYNGTALTKPDVTGWEQSGDTGFVSGEVSNVRATGSATNVSEGEVTNAIAYDGASNFKESNYNINKTEGKLSITAQSIEPSDPSYGGVEISTPENVTYDGSEHRWSPEVKNKAGKALTENTDYTLTYSGDLTNVGTVKVTIAGTGNYTGTVERTYQIIDSEPQAFAVYSASTDGGLLYFFKDTKANIDKAKAAGSYKDVTISDLYEGIEDFDSSEKAPWYKHSNSITSVTVVDEGIAPTSTENWFNGCAKLTSVNLLLLDTSRITTTKFMFAECTTLASLNLSNFKTSSVTDMSGMFIGCSALTTVGNISEWDTSNVTDMSLMFNSCSKLTTLGAEKIEWKTGSVTDMSNMFYDCKNLKADCSGWTVDNVTKHTYFNENATGVTPPNWKTAFAVYSADDNSLNFYKRATVPTAGETIEVQPGTTQTVTTVYEGIETAEYTDTTVPWTKDHKKEITTVNFVDSIQPNNTGYWFYNLLNLTTVNAKNLDTSNVTSMRTMFSQCENLQTIEGVSDWITSRVTDMRKTFKGCSSLTADCSKWDVGAVTQRSDFAKNANGVTLPSAWSNQANASVASNSSSSTLATASVVVGDNASAVSTASDNTSVVAQNADGSSATNNEETATTEVDSTEGTNEATDKVSSTAESDAILQEVNCLSALSKENSSEAEMKAVA